MNISVIGWIKKTSKYNSPVSINPTLLKSTGLHYTMNDENNHTDCKSLSAVDMQATLLRTFSEKIK